MWVENPSIAQYVNYFLLTLRNVHYALSVVSYKGQIKASAITYSGVLTNTYPTNNGIFNDNAKT